MNTYWSRHLNHIRCQVLQECASAKSSPNNLLLVSKTHNEIRYALNKGADPNADDQYTTRSLLRGDTVFDDKKYISLEDMFSSGLQKDAKCFQKRTLLHDCTDEKSLCILLENNVLHGPTDAFGCSAVQSLLCENAWGSATVLLNYGASLDAWSQGRSVPLTNIVTHIVRFWALWPDETIKTLLNKILPHLPDPHLWDEDLCHSIASGLQSARIHKKKWVDLFPEKLVKCGGGEEILYVGYPKVFQQSPLWLAASCNDVGVVKYMLSLGCNIDELDARGQTPLHVAVAAQSFQTIELLLEAGADPNIQDMKGRTCLHMLQRVRNEQHLLNSDIQHFSIDVILALLLYYKANTNIVDHSGCQAGAHLAAVRQPKDVTELNMQVSVATYNALLDWHCRDKLTSVVGSNDTSSFRRL